MPRNLYIAKDYDGHTIGIVIAENEKIANAYFVGRDQIPHSMGVIDPTDERLGVLGLVTLFKTKQVSSSDFSHRSGPVTFIVEDRS
jgi:hypothetical protein